jgi:chemotaxis signal transduction protein
MMKMTSSRVAKRRVTTRQLITFCLRQEGFALPIQVVQKVIPLGEVYDVSSVTGTSLTRYQNQEISVIDIEQRIFSDTALNSDSRLPQLSSSTVLALPEAQLTEINLVSSSQFNTFQQRYLLLLQTAQQELVGISLDTQPMLCRVSESAFTPLPSTVVAEGNIRCISALVVLPNSRPPLFLLNLHQLVQPQTPLLANSNPFFLQ